MDEQNQNNTGVGAMIGWVIVVAVLIIGGIFILGRRATAPADNEPAAPQEIAPGTTTGDEETAAPADPLELETDQELNQQAADLDALESELDNLEGQTR